MDKAIIGIFEWIAELLNFSEAGTSMLSGSLSSLMPSFYSIAAGLSSGAIMPLAYSVLALFMLLELYKASVRIEGSGGGFMTGAEMIFRVLVKMVLCKLVLDHTPQLLAAIHNTFSGLIGGLGSVAGSVDLSSIEAQLEGLSFWELCGIWLLSLVCGIVVMAANLVTRIVILARIVELYLYVAVAPLPVATLPNEEMSSIGKNFLKGFAAIGLQGVLIWLVLRFMPQIFSNLGSSANEGILWSLMDVLVQSLVVVVTLVSSGRIAKSILQAS